MQKLVHLILGILKSTNHLTRTIQHIVFDREDGIYELRMNLSECQCELGKGTGILGISWMDSSGTVQSLPCTQWKAMILCL